MPRLTQRALGLVLGALVLFGIGTSVQAGWLLVLAAALVGAVIAGVVLPVAMVRGVEVTRRAPAEAYAGEDVSVDLLVTNRSGAVRLSLEIHDPFIVPSTAFVASLAAGEAVEVRTVRRRARRGLVDGSPIVVASSAPFGVAEVRRTIAAPGRTIVYPRVARLSDDPSAEPAGAVELGADPARARARGSDTVAGVREYQTGDSLRRVHWALSARHGGLIVREYERHPPRRTAILVDASADVGGPESSLDMCCAIAASVGERALRGGEELTLATGVDGGRHVIRRCGRTELLTRLAEVRAPSRTSISSVVAGLEDVDVLWIVLASNARADGLPEALRRMPATSIVAVVVDAHTFDRRAPGPETVARALAAAGARILTVRAEEDLAECLRTQPSLAV